MGQGLLIGLDVGTSSIKAVAFSLEGETFAIGRSVTPWEVTERGVELDALALADAARSALSDVVRAADQRKVLAIGIASMGESGVLVNARHEPIAPVLAWHDRRDETQLVQLEDALGPASFSRRTGLPFGQQWSLTKHLWLSQNLPTVRNAVQRMNIAEWIAFSLGASPVTEHSLASRTGWFGLTEKTWWEEALEWSQVRASMFPQLVDAGITIGTVTSRAEIPALTGAAITIAGHDHQAAAIGVGAVGLGDELDSCGTAEALVRTIKPELDADAIEHLTARGISVGWHVLAGHWCLLGGTQGGLVLQRAMALLGLGRDQLTSVDRQATAVSSSKLTATISRGAVLALTGIEDGATPAHFWYAAVDAVTEQSKEIHEAMSELTGPHRRLVVTGGWANSSTVVELKRRKFGPIEHSQVAEAGARGAAIFAGISAGLWANPASAPWTYGDGRLTS